MTGLTAEAHPPPSPTHRKQVLREQNEVHERGREVEADLRCTNLFWASGPPAPTPAPAFRPRRYGPFDCCCPKLDPGREMCSSSPPRPKVIGALAPPKQTKGAMTSGFEMTSTTLTLCQTHSVQSSAMLYNPNVLCRAAPTVTRRSNASWAPLGQPFPLPRLRGDPLLTPQNGGGGQSMCARARHMVGLRQGGGGAQSRSVLID